MPSAPLSRRHFLRGATLAGCSAAAWPLMSHVTLAAAPGDHRLVVIILRGAMDGLDALRPVGDPDFATLRAASLTGDAPALPLDGFFALHPDMGGLMPLWQKGELAFAHAVATPYRDRRSHFDGQDILEAGTGMDLAPDQVRGGWLNRMIQSVPGMTSETAYAVGRSGLKVIAGDAPVTQWSPDTRVELDDQTQRLLERIYEDDPLFHAAGNEAFDLLARADAGMMDDGDAAGAAALAEFAAARLNEEARIAAFSISGWDTHRNQKGVLGRRLRGLSAALLALRDGLGDAWGQTTVLAMTEFGRTARENGTNGTDHGTGSALIMAGGALRGGRVYGAWPGLAAADLYQERDLLPTADVRAYAAWAMRGLYGLERTLLEASVFPGLDMGTDPGILL
ncbi:DUF1501 domain-containing protein [Sinisalibacter aestuarii]|uniref:DUF1501 domain-containing protein n=1 Tax=Sinisalibacter aestuarii TaxID=2949426 RepID=A0ABQ5LTW9_9RHOB|nr:DUF1501 domain-containing protein [Sinisalibacter aestuarii]GKY87786.1 hypothetical protein STA1M1_16550 [Sinisalibacter aestuarii]